MAIKSGIEVGAVLWKYSQIERELIYNRRQHQYEHVEVEKYFYIRLTTRRGRTNGWIVGRHVFPFFNSIGIKLIQRNEYGETRYTAVGTTVARSMTKELWDNLTIDETAQRWYSRIKKKEIALLLESAHDSLSTEGLEDMEQYLTDDTSEVDNWPPEFNHPIKNMQVSGSYIHPLVWN